MGRRSARIAVPDPRREGARDPRRPLRRLDDDVAALARPTLQHRLILNYRAEAEGLRAGELVDRLLSCRHAVTRSNASIRSQLARLGSLPIKARVIVEGALSGMHRAIGARRVGRVRRAQGVLARRRAPPRRLEGVRASSIATT